LEKFVRHDHGKSLGGTITYCYNKRKRPDKYVCIDSYCIITTIYVFLPQGDCGLEGLYLGILAILMLSLLYVIVKVAICQKRDEKMVSCGTDLNMIFIIDMGENL
jgi:hypothetical protein